MKVSNEFKVGAIAIVAIVFLVLGFNFLKGKQLFKSNTVIVGIYGNVHGLANSNAVTINGLQVGTVYSITTDKDMRKIAVQLNITKNIHIPSNSVAIIKPNPLGTTTIDIRLGNANTYLKNKDTIPTSESAGIFEEVFQKVDPVMYQVKKAIGSLDTLIANINSVIDTKAKGNIGTTLDNLTKLTTSLTYSAASLQALLNSQTGLVAKTLDNLNNVTGNLASNNPKINNIVDNLDRTTNHLAAINLKKTIDSIEVAVNGLKQIIETINSNKGTMGKLLNDPALYNNIASTGNKLNLLLDDIRVNPKRYVSISVFGKKNKTTPLTTPLPDTVNSPYLLKKQND